MNPFWIAIFCGVVMTASAQNPTAESIVSRMAARYAAVRSYQDTGVVLSHWQHKPGPDELHFKTYFVRPDRFRFEWIDHHPYPPLRHLTSFHVIWSNSTGAYTYWQKGEKTERERDLAMAVAGATGVSDGSAHTVPRLLTDKVTGFALTDLKSLTLRGQSEFEGTPCYQIRGTHPNGGLYELWIGVEDLLLRKLETRHSPNVVEEQIHRDIQIDADIPEATFNFEPHK